MSNSGALPNQMVMASQTSFFLLLTKCKRNHYIPKLKLKLSSNNFYLKVYIVHIYLSIVQRGEYILEFLINIDKIPNISHTFPIPKRRITFYGNKRPVHYLANEERSGQRTMEILQHFKSFIKNNSIFLLLKFITNFRK